MADEDEVLNAASGLFQEPEGFYKPDDDTKTYDEHTMLSGKKVAVRLVGKNPLWGHLLWNASRIVSNYLEERAETLIVGKDVLEFGAGAGLPSLVSAIMGARTVLVTDYPDPDLIENLQFNITTTIPEQLQQNIHAEGYIWGYPPEKLTSHLPQPSSGFDVLILADLLFNHSEHRKLVLSVQQTLKRSPSSRALVFFTPHRPWLLDKDLAFFDLAREIGLIVNKVFEQVMEKALIQDRGDQTLLRTVFGYEMLWPQGNEIDNER